jgi:hypothetical protein
VKRIAVLATLVGALALLATSCGGGDDSSESSATVEWADGLCTAISGWTAELQQVGEQFQSLSDLNEDSLEQAANDVKSATNTLVDDLKSLGTPDTESGQEAKQAVDDLASEAEDGVAEIETTVQGISSPTDLPGAISTLTATLTSLSTAVTSTLQTLENADVKGELEDAFEQAPACSQLAES